MAGALAGLIFLAGFGLLVYPSVSDQWNTWRQNRLISDYEEAVSTGMTEGDFTEEWEKARAFNASFTENSIYGDIFGSLQEETGTGENVSYRQVLDLTGDGVMGYITIPKIEQKLALYHGTAEEVLQHGVGHLQGTKLPIGGENNHSVLAAHRGLPGARLFTDIDKLEAGDVFYIKVLDETLAYEVDRVLPMVDKDDAETLKEALGIQPGEDCVTLFTCTPYGVNSHRLLVRGSRVPYGGEAEEERTPVQEMVRAVKDYYMLYLLPGLAAAWLGVLVLKPGSRAGKKTGKRESEGGS